MWGTQIGATGYTRARAYDSNTPLPHAHTWKGMCLNNIGCTSNSFHQYLTYCQENCTRFTVRNLPWNWGCSSRSCYLILGWSALQAVQTSSRINTMFKIIYSVETLPWRRKQQLSYTIHMTNLGNSSLPQIDSYDGTTNSVCGIDRYRMRLYIWYDN